MFDAAKTPPSLVEPGDRIRFRLADRAEEGNSRSTGSVEESFRATAQASQDAPEGLTVLAAGLFTTVQGQ